MADRDCNGCTVSELGTILRYYGANPTVADIEKLVALCDKDGNNVLSKAEFKILIAKPEFYRYLDEPDHATTMVRTVRRCDGATVYTTVRRLDVPRAPRQPQHNAQRNQQCEPAVLVHVRPSAMPLQGSAERRWWWWWWRGRGAIVACNRKTRRAAPFFLTPSITLTISICAYAARFA